MTKHFCDICGKMLTHDSAYYMLSSDRVPALEHRYLVPGVYSDAVPTTYEPCKPMSMDLCKECYEDLTKYISRKAQDNLKKMVDSWFVEDVKNVGDNEK